MSLLCDYCGRDLDEIWQCNMSHEPFSVLCEDCSGYTLKKELEDNENISLSEEE